MGNNISGTKHIEQFYDACDIDKIIANATGLPSNSASPTDLLILTLDNNIKYQNESFSNKQVFMKFWINDDMEIRKYISNTLPSAYLDNFIMRNKALNYELMIYRDIIRILIDEKICTNFVRCLGSSSSCNVDLISNLMSKNSAVVLAKKNFRRNFQYILRGLSNRPSLTDNTNLLPAGVTIADMVSLGNSIDTFSIGCVISEYKTGISFADWYKTNRPTGFTGPTEDLKKILFQVCCGCYAMHLSRVVHNDLHLGNVRLSTALDPQERIFKYDTDSYGSDIKFECSIKAMIYDFDRAYSSVLGINDILRPDCNTNSYCNSIREGFDFTYFIINLIMYEYSLGANYNTIDYLSTLISTSATKNFMLTKIFLILNDITKTVTRTAPTFPHPSSCMKFPYRSYSYMIDNMANTLATDSSLPDATINSNTIHKNLFNPNSGIFKNRKNENDCSKFKEIINEKDLQISTLTQNIQIVNEDNDWDTTSISSSFPFVNKNKGSRLGTKKNNTPPKVALPKWGRGLKKSPAAPIQKASKSPRLSRSRPQSGRRMSGGSPSTRRRSGSPSTRRRSGSPFTRRRSGSPYTRRK